MALELGLEGSGGFSRGEEWVGKGRLVSPLVGFDFFKTLSSALTRRPHTGHAP